MTALNIDTTKWDFNDDDWGGIDEGIKKCVIFLNLLGINTAGSCAGHAERNNVMPEICITSSTAESDDTWSKEEDDRLTGLTQELLEEFYRKREVSDLKKIVIIQSGMMSSLHNGGNLWKEWRCMVDDRSRRIKNGEEVKKWIPTEDEIKEREIISKELLTEFDDFTEFLVSIYNKKNSKN
jgi:hypothetical protein